MTNLYSHIQSRLLTRGDRVVVAADSARLTGAALDSAVGRYANALLALGVQAGDRIAVQVDKSVENIVLYLASLRVGAIYVPLNSAYRPAEVATFLQDATPRLFICDPSRQSTLHPVAAS